MRALLLGLLLLPACGGEAASPGQDEPAWPSDGFLHYLPEDLSVTVRLPRTWDDRPVQAILDALGRSAPWAADGLDPGRHGGLALTSQGAVVQYLPAKDKAAVNKALGDKVRALAYREEGDWVILSRGGKGAGTHEGAPLPPGEAAVRVRYHPLLDAFFSPGDTLELGATLGAAGADLSGRLRPADKGPTRARVEAAAELQDEWLDFIPGTLAVRLETTLPAPALAATITRRLGRHAGIADQKDRVLVERLLREMLTAVDSAAGWACGVDFHASGASAVMVGRIAAGPASPILVGLRKRGRTTVGPLVLDLRREVPRGALGFWAWVIDAKPKIEGLPECAWGAVARLSNEDEGLRASYARFGDKFVAAVGPRGDLLLKAVARRLRAGASRTPASHALRAARDRAPGAPYVLGIAIHGPGFAGLPPGDRAALARSLGGGENAKAPTVAAFAGFQKAGELWIEGRVLY